jgi:hypothetical protein
MCLGKIKLMMMLKVQKVDQKVNQVPRFHPGLVLHNLEEVERVVVANLPWHQLLQDQPEEIILLLIGDK